MQYDRYTTRIVVGLTSAAADALRARVTAAGPDIRGLDAVAAALNLGMVAKVLGGHPGLDYLPDLRGNSVIQQVRNEARLKRAEAPVRGVVGFFIIDAFKLSPAERNALVDELKKLPDWIKTAHRQPNYAPSTKKKIAKAASPKLEVKAADHLSPTPWSIGVRDRGAWVGFDGLGVGFADVEAPNSGWNIEHEAFTTIHFGPGIERSAIPPGAHGTHVLGVVAASRESANPGIAPACTLHALSRADGGDMATAITDATEHLEPGDVLLIPADWLGAPVEVTEEVFLAIEQATTFGIVVIEAAGNQRHEYAEIDLDALVTDDERLPYWAENRTPTGEPPNSRAIIVSACNRAHGPSPHHRHSILAGVSFGSRVDCYGWGEDVMTLGSSGYDDFDYEFTHTSSASSMIAGLALLVQQKAKRDLGAPLKPGQMQALFRNPAVGTEVTYGNNHHSRIPDFGMIAKWLDTHGPPPDPPRGTDR